MIVLIVDDRKSLLETFPEWSRKSMLSVINTMSDDFLNAKQVRCSRVVMAADFDFSIPYFLTNPFIKTVVVKLWEHLFSCLGLQRNYRTFRSLQLL